MTYCSLNTIVAQYKNCLLELILRLSTKISITATESAEIPDDFAKQL
jgi:hypothetical protein